MRNLSQNDDEEQKGERLITGDELLQLQGFPLHRVPDDVVAGASNALKTTMAGNMFNGGTYITMIIAILIAFPLSVLSCAYNSRGDDEESEAITTY